MADQTYSIKRDSISFDNPAVVDSPVLTFTTGTAETWLVRQICISGPVLDAPTVGGTRPVRTVTATVAIDDTVYLTTYAGSADQADGDPLILHPSESLIISWFGNWPLATAGVRPTFKAVLLVQSLSV